MSMSIVTTPWRRALNFVALATLIAPMIAACGGGGLGATVKRSAFSTKEYGVTSSPRVTSNPNPPKGGGRYQVGKPYTVRGKVYVPQEDPDYAASGDASWYGADFHGRRTANGEIFSANAITGAHPTLPLPSYSGPADFGGTGHSNTRYASNDSTNSLADMAGNFFGGLFAYADTTPEEQDLAIGSAHAAVTAMATRSTALESWVQSVDADARSIKLGLGVFSDQNNAIALSEQFALLGAVDEEPVTVNGKAATRLTLTHLKPGVSRVDALDLARQLGLNDIILY